MSGTNRQIKLGRKVMMMMLPADTSPAIHSMMVVTSPMGDHAPPALAATITILAKNQRSWRSPMSLRSSATITMEVVRLSKTADMKKARMEMTHSSFTLLVVEILSVIMRKPPSVSMSSTIVIAPIRKKRISAISPRAWMSCEWTSQSVKVLPGLLIWKSRRAEVSTRMPWPPETAQTHSTTPSNRAVAVLLIFKGCSKAMTV